MTLTPEHGVMELFSRNRLRLVLVQMVSCCINEIPSNTLIRGPLHVNILKVYQFDEHTSQIILTGY